MSEAILQLSVLREKELQAVQSGSRRQRNMQRLPVDATLQKGLQAYLYTKQVNIPSLIAYLKQRILPMQENYVLCSRIYLFVVFYTCIRMRNKTKGIFPAVSQVFQSVFTNTVFPGITVSADLRVYILMMTIMSCLRIP